MSVSQRCRDEPWRFECQFPQPIQKKFRMSGIQDFTSPAPRTPVPTLTIQQRRQGIPTRDLTGSTVFADQIDRQQRRGPASVNVNRLSQINRAVARPDFNVQQFFKQTSRKIQKEKVKTLKKLNMGTTEVIHSPEEVLNAYLAEAAYRNAYGSTNKAEAFVKSGAEVLPQLADMLIIRDSRFTNNEHVAFRNSRTGKVYLSFRGSDGEFFKPEANIESMMKGKGLRIKNAVDWGTNLHTLGGVENKTKRYKSAVDTAIELAEFTGTPMEDLNLTGHSLGGGQADHVSEVTGSKSFSFDPARNPFAKRYQQPVHPTSRIKSRGTHFDPIGLARNAYAKYKGGHPEHIEMKNYTAVPGHESSFVDHHLLFEQFIEPLSLNENGDIVSTRTTPIRNTASMVGGAAKTGVSKVSEAGASLVGVAAPFALTPEYPTKAEKHFRQGEGVVENAKLSLAMSNSLFRVNPMFALLDEPAMMATIIDFDLNLSPHDKNEIARGLGFKVVDKPYVYQRAPKIIRSLQLPERRREEKQMQQIQDLADRYGIDFIQAANLTKESDPGAPILDTNQALADAAGRLEATAGELNQEGDFVAEDGRVFREQK